MKRIAACLIVLAVTSSAYASDSDDGMYVVGSVGHAGYINTSIQSANNDTLSGNSNTTSNGVAVHNLNNLHSIQDISRTGFKLQLGYEFSPNLAIEGGYVDLGKTTYSATYKSSDTTWLSPFSPATTSTGTITRTNKVTGWNVGGLGIIPINNSFSVFAKLGLANMKLKKSNSGTGFFATTSESTDTKIEPYYGIGASFYPSRDHSLGIRAEWERFSKAGNLDQDGTADATLMTVGVSSKF